MTDTIYLRYVDHQTVEAEEYSAALMQMVFGGKVDTRLNEDNISIIVYPCFNPTPIAQEKMEQEIRDAGYEIKYLNDPPVPAVFDREHTQDTPGHDSPRVPPAPDTHTHQPLFRIEAARFDDPIALRSDMIGLDYLPTTDEILMHTKPPTHMFIKSVKETGVRVPILLDWDGETSITMDNLIAGRKRIIAARLAGRDTIRCDYAVGLTEEQALRLMAEDNNLRQDNPLTDFEVIKRLVEKYAPMIAPGIDPDDIVELPKSIVRTIAREIPGLGQPPFASGGN